MQPLPCHLFEQTEFILPRVQFAIHRKRSQRALLQMTDFMHKQCDRAWVISQRRLLRIVAGVQIELSTEGPKRADAFSRAPQTDPNPVCPHKLHRPPTLLRRASHLLQIILQPFRIVHCDRNSRSMISRRAETSSLNPESSIFTSSTRAKNSFPPPVTWMS